MDESTVKSEFQEWFKKTYPEAIFGEQDHFDYTERDLLDCWKAAITMIVNWCNCKQDRTKPIDYGTYSENPPPPPICCRPDPPPPPPRPNNEWKPTPEMEIERMAATGGSFIPPDIQKALHEKKRQEDDHQ